MKKIIRRIIVSFITILVFLFAWGCYYLEYDLNRLPGGELVSSSTSPDGNYTVKAYKSSGGATTNWTIKGVVQNNNNSKKRVIYWDEAKSAHIVWRDKNIVSMNNKKIDIIKGSYDYRHD
ncbi:DUF5412 family protein [Priestia aryabhattai]|uniref:DUF5412 family protein n=1 Tax=Priestia aryabhattai TaxID=412384 RepID=UPI000A89ABD7|nr:DUF5412 family protein [Priestia aryabhattai]